MNIPSLVSDLCSKCLQIDKKCSILAASTALAFYVIMKKDNESKTVTEKLKESDKKCDRMEDSFLKDTENVLKMISDSSFTSEVDVSSLNSTYPDMTLSFNATLDQVEDTEDELENFDTDRLTNPVINRNFWRLLDTTVGDISYHASDMTHGDIGDMTTDDMGDSCDHDVSDLQWQSPGRDTWSWSHWHGVTRHSTNTFSDYGSLEDDEDDKASDGASDISSNTSYTGSGAFK